MEGKFATAPHWRGQRVGWVVLGLFIVAGALGLFGGGLLGRAEIGAGRLAVDYPRFARVAVVTEMRLRIRPAPGATVVRLRLPEAYVDRMEVERLSPEPMESELGDGWITYLFPVVVGAREGLVTVHFKPARAGVVEGAAALDGEAPLPLRHFIYP